MKINSQKALKILTPDESANLVSKFYPAAVTEKGQPYSKQRFTNLHCGLNRHLTSPPFNRIINLSKDRGFMQANKVLRGILRMNKKQGIVKGKQPKAVSKMSSRGIKCPVQKMNSLKQMFQS